MIDLHGVSIAYDGTAVINGMSFNIAPGEIVALVGENGCGKSTLGRAICAAQLVDGGAVVVDGHDPSASELERLRVRELVGYVRQDPLDQIVSSLVFDEVAFGPRNLGIDEDEVARRVDEALELSLLHGFDQRVTTELSGGEQQRLALAGVLAMRPRYLVLDEPTSQLDPRSRELMRGLFTALSHERGLGLVLITHDDDEIALADRVIVCDGSVARGSACGEAHSGAETRIEAGLRVDVGRRVTGGAARETVVSLDGVVSSRGGRTVLDGVDLDLHAGELVMLAGASGAGKSTLTSLAAGLLEPDAGAVRVCGHAVTPGMVGVAFQQPEVQFFHDTVFDEVAFAPRNAGFDEGEVRVLVERSIGAVGLPVDVLERSPFELSGGQARRVAIASVIALDAPAYIFDEPSAALDAEGRSFIHRLACELVNEGRAVLVVTHDLPEWERLADRVLVLEGGVLRPDHLEGTQARSAHADEPSALKRPSARSQAPMGPFGGYVAGTLLAHVDARVKIAVLLVATLGVFTAADAWEWCFWFAALAVTVFSARMGARDVLRGMRPVAIILMFTLVANLVSCDGHGAVPLVGPARFDPAGGMRGVTAVVRILILVGFSLAVSSSTTATQISDAVVRLLRPLAHFGMPVAALGTVLSLALRFIPLVSEELGRIRLAQRARGARFDEGGLVERIRIWGSVLTPLVVGLFRRADRLAEAMSARCYDASSEGRLPVPRPLGRRDRALLVVSLTSMAAVIAVSLIG